MAITPNDKSASTGTKKTIAPQPIRDQLNNKAEKYCIGCGKAEEANLYLCDCCQGAWYCSHSCEEADRPVHGLLCAEYAQLNEVLGPDGEGGGARAFLFRAGSLGPELVLLPARRSDLVCDLVRDRSMEEAGLCTSFVDMWGFGANGRIARKPRIGEHTLELWVLDEFICDGSPWNKSIFTSVKACPTAPFKMPPNPWAGNAVVHRNNLKSVTMADLRHVVDWFSMYPMTSSHRRSSSSPAGPSPQNLELCQSLINFPAVKGVVVQFDYSKASGPVIEYREEYVPCTNPIRGLRTSTTGVLSPISEALGLPLRVLEQDAIKLPLNPLGRVANHALFSLMRPMEPNPDPSQLGTKWLGVGKALVVRADDENLRREELLAMVRLSASLVEADNVNRPRQPVDRARFLNPGVAARERQRELVTWDNYLKHVAELDAPRPPQTTAKAAFLDLRAAPTVYYDGNSPGYLVFL